MAYPFYNFPDGRFDSRFNGFGGNLNCKIQFFDDPVNMGRNQEFYATRVQRPLDHSSDLTLQSPLNCPLPLGPANPSLDTTVVRAYADLARHTAAYERALRSYKVVATPKYRGAERGGTTLKPTTRNYEDREFALRNALADCRISQRNLAIMNPSSSCPGRSLFTVFGESDGPDRYVLRPIGSGLTTYRVDRISLLQPDDDDDRGGSDDQELLTLEWHNRTEFELSHAPLCVATLNLNGDYCSGLEHITKDHGPSDRKFLHAISQPDHVTIYGGAASAAGASSAGSDGAPVTILPFKSCRSIHNHPCTATHVVLSSSTSGTVSCFDLESLRLSKDNSSPHTSWSRKFSELAPCGPNVYYTSHPRVLTFLTRSTFGTFDIRCADRTVSVALDVASWLATSSSSSLEGSMPYPRAPYLHVLYTGADAYVVDVRYRNSVLYGTVSPLQTGIARVRTLSVTDTHTPEALISAGSDRFGEIVMFPASAGGVGVCTLTTGPFFKLPPLPALCYERSGDGISGSTSIHPSQTALISSRAGPDTKLLDFDLVRMMSQRRSTAAYVVQLTVYGDLFYSRFTYPLGVLGRARDCDAARDQTKVRSRSDSIWKEWAGQLIEAVGGDEKRRDGAREKESGLNTHPTDVDDDCGYDGGGREIVPNIDPGLMEAILANMVSDTFTSPEAVETFHQSPTVIPEYLTTPVAQVECEDYLGIKIRDMWANDHDTA